MALATTLSDSTFTGLPLLLRSRCGRLGPGVERERDDQPVSGDRVALVLPQAPETAAAHIGIYKLGAIAVPLSGLFGVGGGQLQIG